MIFVCAFLLLVLVASTDVELLGLPLSSADRGRIRISRVHKHGPSSLREMRSSTTSVIEHADSKSIVQIESGVIKQILFAAFQYTISMSLGVLDVGDFVWDFVGRSFQLEVGLRRIGWFNHDIEPYSVSDARGGVNRSEPTSRYSGIIYMLEPRFRPSVVSANTTLIQDRKAESVYSQISELVNGLSSLYMTFPVGKILLSYFLFTDTAFGGQLALTLYSFALVLVRTSYFALLDMDMRMPIPKRTSTEGIYHRYHQQLQEPTDLAIFLLTQNGTHTT